MASEADRISMSSPRFEIAPRSSTSLRRLSSSRCRLPASSGGASPTSTIRKLLPWGPVRRSLAAARRSKNPFDSV